MPAPSPLDVLAEELGSLAGRVERESKLRIDAALADIARRDAERDLRFERLERDVRDRLAGLKDGQPGDAGKSVTIDDVRPVLADMVAALPPAQNGADADPAVIERLVAEAVAKIPPAAPGKSVTVEDVRPMLAEMVAALPLAEKGKDADPAVIERLVSEAVSRIPPAAAGKSVTIDDVRPVLAEMVAALPKAKDGADADPAVIESMIAKAVANIPAPTPGKSVTVEEVRPLIVEEVAKIPRPKDGTSVTVDDVLPLIVAEVAKIPAPPSGKEGPPGKLPIVTEWVDRVHYESYCVTHGGATYQAIRDTGREPPHEDWRCIAQAGKDGSDGRSFVVRGTFDPECEDYKALNVVALGGAGFVARKDNPGLCPGEGWQLIASQGKRGNPGEPGKRGEPGPRGPKGDEVVALTVEDDGVLTLTTDVGSQIRCDLYPLLDKLQRA